MRRVILTIILILGAVFVIYSFSEIKKITGILEQSDWRFLVVAFFFVILWMYNIALEYRLLYSLVGLQEQRFRLLLVSSAATFVNVIMPTAGIGGMAVFLDDARRRNHSTGRVMVVGALFLLMDYAAFLCVLALGWVVLIRRNDLNAGEVTASLILLALSLTIASLVYLGFRSSTALGNVLAKMARGVNRVTRLITHRDYLSEERAHAFAAEMANGLATIRNKKKNLIWPFLFALNSKAILICVLAFTFLALGTPFSVGTLVGGFSIGYLFFIVSPTPSGLGVVEGVMTVALNTLRVKLEAAVLITMTYRGLTFWFPLGLGGLSLRMLQRQSGAPRKLPKADPKGHGSLNTEK